MAGDYIKEALSGSSEPVAGTSVYDDIDAYHASQYTKLVAKMNRQANDPALVPHTARLRVLNDEPYGGGTGGVRVNAAPRQIDPSAGLTLANSKLLHPSVKRSAPFEEGTQG